MDNEGMNVLFTQGTSILLIPMLIQWLKRTKICPWMSYDTETLNRVVSWTLGVISAVGIHWVGDWQGSVLTLSIDFSGVTVGSVVHEIAIIAGQLGGQQFAYRILRAGELIEQVLKAQVALLPQKEQVTFQPVVK